MINVSVYSCGTSDLLPSEAWQGSDHALRKVYVEAINFYEFV
jgi:hypothetical protein